MMKNKMIDRYILLAAFLTMVPLGAMAGENPSAKAPGSQKGSLFESFFGSSSGKAVHSTVQFTPAKSVSTPSASVVNDAPAIAMPSMQSSSSLFRHSAVPVGVATRSTSSSSQATSGTSVLGTLSTDRLKRTGGTSGGFSGGMTAGGLMSSGSRYAGGSANGGGGTAMTSSGPSISDGPRKGFVDDDDPLPDPEQPLGDAVIPLMLLACAYVLLRVYRRKRSV